MGTQLIRLILNAVQSADRKAGLVWGGSGLAQSLASAVDFGLWVICSTSGNTVSWLISNMLIRDTMSLSETCEETTEHTIIDQLAYDTFI